VTSGFLFFEHHIFENCYEPYVSSDKLYKKIKLKAMHSTLICFFLLPCFQHSTSSSACNHEASFWCWAEAIFVGNVMPSTWGLLQNRTNHLSLAFSEHMSLGVFKVGMSLTILAVFNTSTYLFFLLSWKNLYRCLDLLFCDFPTCLL
jgi:hypothetical protein